jgi:hypothetical protein
MKEGFDEGEREDQLRAMAGGATAAAEAVRGVKEKARTGLVGMEEPVWPGKPVRSVQPAVQVRRRGRPLLKWAVEKGVRGLEEMMIRRMRIGGRVRRAGEELGRRQLLHQAGFRTSGGAGHRPNPPKQKQQIGVVAPPPGA